MDDRQLNLVDHVKSVNIPTIIESTCSVVACNYLSLPGNQPGATAFWYKTFCRTRMHVYIQRALTLSRRASTMYNVLNRAQASAVAIVWPHSKTSAHRRRWRCACKRMCVYIFSPRHIDADVAATAIAVVETLASRRLVVFHPSSAATSNNVCALVGKV